MYEVFLNDSKLVFTSEFNISSKNNILEIIDIQNVEDIFKLLERIEAQPVPQAGTVVCRTTPVLRETLPQAFKQIAAAGGLVRDAGCRYLFIRRFGRWDLPKGAVEKGEEVSAAAIREVEEECGINTLEIIRPLPGTFHLYRSKHLPSGKNWVLKHTAWFEMIHHGNGQTTPQQEEGIEEARWFEQSELTEVISSTYGSLRNMLSGYFTER